MTGNRTESKNAPDHGGQKVIGKYRIVRELGRGGMGVVYLARDTTLDREVAIKMVRPSIAGSRDSLDRFMREAQAVATLAHPNIVHINTFDEIDGELLIEMPYLAGGSMRSAMNSGMSLGKLVRVIHDGLCALECCHAEAIVHRDVKPSNILFDGRGTTKLSDFGAATLAIGEDSNLVGRDQTTFLGTPCYCCPEAWEGEPPTPKWDLYALGMIAREALVGELPYSTDSPLAYIRDLASKRLPPLSESVRDVSPEIASLIDDLVDRDPERRPETANEALVRLRDTREYDAMNDPLQPTITMAVKMIQPTLSWRLKTWTKRLRRGRRSIAAAMAGLLLGGTVVGAAVGLGRTPPISPAPANPIIRPVETQRIAFMDAMPSVAAIAAMTREPTRGLQRVYDLRMSESPGTKNEVIVVRAHGDEPAQLVGVLGDYFTFLTLTINDDGTLAGSGMWGTYADPGGRYLLVGSLTVTAEWSGEITDPMWLTLHYVSDLDPEAWTETAFAVPSPRDVTDTSALLSLESHPAAMPVFFRDLWPRYPKQSAQLERMLPAIDGGHVQATFAEGFAAVNVDGILDEEIWTESLASAYVGRPSRAQPRLAAVAFADGLGLAIDAPYELEDDLELLVALMPIYHVPAESSPYLRIHMTESTLDVVQRKGDLDSPLLGGYQAAITHDQGRVRVEITLTSEALGRTWSPLQGDAMRVNAQLVTQQGTPAYVWGWPELDAVQHGALLLISRVPLQQSSR